MSFVDLVAFLVRGLLRSNRAVDGCGEAGTRLAPSACVGRDRDRPRDTKAEENTNITGTDPPYHASDPTFHVSTEPPPQGGSTVLRARRSRASDEQPGADSVTL